VNSCFLGNTSIFYAEGPNFEPMYGGALFMVLGADKNNLRFSANLKESLRGVDFVQGNAQSLRTKSLVA
jgi:hypothetical protein